MGSFFFNIIIFHIICNLTFGQESTTTKISMKNKCLNPPRTARKVENHIRICQDEVKNKIIIEALDLIRSQDDNSEYDDDDKGLHSILSSPETLESDPHHQDNDIHDTFKRRISTYHPTLVPFEQKRIAGCLLHCVYAKNNAIDKLGWPTLDGLVDFYAEGVNEHGFFMATLRAANACLKAATHKYQVNRHIAPEKGESCDVAFDVFDCVSDHITDYCLDHFY